jgi:hypothetical protein
LDNQLSNQEEDVMTSREKLEIALRVMRRQGSTGEGLAEPLRLVQEVLSALPADPKPAPLSELELSPEVIASVERGLQEAAEGKLHDMGSFAAYADDDLDDDETISYDPEEEAPAEEEEPEKETEG